MFEIEDDKISKTDRTMLAHLTPLTGPNDGADTYLCSVSKFLKNEYIWSVEEKVKAWVERNGGTMQRLGEAPIYKDDRKGFRVQIRFPAYAKRDMKNILASLYEPAKKSQQKKERQRREERSI